MNYQRGQNPNSRNGFKIGHDVSSSLRSKVSEAHKGKPMTDKLKKILCLANTGRKCSEETRRKIGEAQKGEKARNWQGGKTEEIRLLRMSVEYKLWREAVFERDNYICRFCGQKGGKLNADHIKPFSDYPELRLAIDNGRTLCENCHRNTPTFGVHERKRL